MRLAQCPNDACSAVSPTEEWDTIDLPCEDCGTHASAMCPVCEEAFDLVQVDELICDAPLPT
jgi:hypothetical protein